MPGRGVAAENWHLTLRFLGEIEPVAARAVAREVAGAVLGPPFAVSFGGLGAFPRPERARVLWLGVDEGEAGLRRVAERLETAIRQAGLPAEPRPFSAHLTLSRLREPTDVRSLIRRAPPFGRRMQVTEVVLYRSHLGSGPTPYEAVERFPLG